MRLESVFLAEHAAAYEKKLNVLGGLIGELLADELPVRVEHLVAVFILDLTDEQVDIGGKTQALEGTLRDPLGGVTPVRFNGQPIGLRPGYQSFLYLPVVLELPRAGRYTLTVRAEGTDQEVSTTFEVFDMRPER